MFNGNAGANSICCDYHIRGGGDRNANDAALVAIGPVSSCGAVAAQAKQANALLPEQGQGGQGGQGGRTLFGRETPFPLVSAYRPVTRTRSPVTGLNAWPGRYNRLGRRYYGLEGQGGQGGQGAVQDSGQDGGDMSGFGFAWDSGSSFAPSSTTSGGLDWNQIIHDITVAVPNVFAARKAGSTYTYTVPGAPTGGQGAPQVYAQAPAGYTYNQQGQLIPVGSAAGAAAQAGAGAAQIANSISTFVTENPLLVLGGVLGLVLLFRQPPGRR